MASAAQAQAQANLAATRAYNLLNKSTAAKREGVGFNLDSLQSQSVSDLVRSYDQVQIKSGGGQQLILQRAVNGNAVNPQADLNNAGVLQIVPDVGGARNALIDAQVKAKAAATPEWEKIAIPAGIGLVVLSTIVLVIRHG